MAAQVTARKGPARNAKKPETEQSEAGVLDQADGSPAPEPKKTKAKAGPSTKAEKAKASGSGPAQPVRIVRTPVGRKVGGIPRAIEKKPTNRAPERSPPLPPIRRPEGRDRLAEEADARRRKRRISEGLAGPGSRVKRLQKGKTIPLKVDPVSAVKGKRIIRIPKSVPPVASRSQAVGLRY